MVRKRRDVGVYVVWLLKVKLELESNHAMSFKKVPRTSASNTELNSLHIRSRVLLTSPEFIAARRF